MGNFFTDAAGAINWQAMTSFISLLAVFMGSLAALIAVFRLNTIIQAFREFKNARDRLSDLLEAVRELVKVTPTLMAAADDLAEDLKDLKRTKTPSQETNPATASDNFTATSDEVASEESKWGEVSTIWRGVRNQLQEIIAKISDGRVQRKYNGMPRYNYADVIKTLQEDGYLAENRAQAASQMSGRFLDLRPRKQNVTDEDVMQFRQWEKDFEGK